MSSAALEKLIIDYHELNASTIDELDLEPSPLEFMRYVARNRPFVVRGGASDWPATRRWDCQYLRAVMGNSRVNVAITPSGNADSVTTDPADGKRCFVKPLEEEEGFGEFLDSVQSRGREPGAGLPEVKYAQTQNDNLRGEYAALYRDVEPSIAWARIALEQEPDAINLWIGNSRSVTALHRDNYENVYCQIIGSKHFVLLPPVEMPCVNEQLLRPATYVRRNANEPCSELAGLAIKQDQDAEPIPFATWDPDQPEENATPFSQFSQPMRVDLKPGDMLYLPALWYHKVSQSGGPEGICSAVNYWYDMDFSGAAYATSVFIRDIAKSLSQDPLEVI